VGKNILILTPFYSPNVGGAETFTDGLVKEVSKWHDVTVLTFQPFQGHVYSYEERFTKRGSLKVKRLRWLISPKGAWKGNTAINFFLVFPKMVLFAFLNLINKRFDIIHAQGLISGLVAVILKKMFRLRVLITLLALYNFKNWTGITAKLAKYILKNCDVIFVEGENGKDDLKEFGLDATRIRIFQHWCDTSMFRPPENRDKSKIRVLFVGRRFPEKGRHIIEAAERILNNPKYEFIYVENCEYKDLPKYYQMAHIVVVPSLYPEGFSRVVIEAASCGCASCRRATRRAGTCSSRGTSGPRAGGSSWMRCARRRRAASTAPTGTSAD